MLLIGETYNERKAIILDEIKVSRSLIRTCNKCVKTFPKQRNEWLEIIEAENTFIKEKMAELAELVKWRKTENLEVDQRYKIYEGDYGEQLASP